MQVFRSLSLPSRLFSSWFAPLISGIVFAALLLATAAGAQAEDGSAAWLRYAPISNTAQYRRLPSRIAFAGDSASDRAAAAEMQHGLSSMLGRPFTTEPLSKDSPGQGNAIVLGSFTNVRSILPAAQRAKPVSGEAFRISLRKQGAHTQLYVIGGTPQSELYAAFHLLEEVGAQKPIPAEDDESPSAPVRWVDQWDNPNGTIERGFAGRSIFFNNGHVRQDMTRAGEYARLLASIGINGCNVNNVNADPQLLTDENLRGIARIADAFRPWGVKLALSVALSSPETLGGLTTFDPKNPEVIAWWQKKVDEIYALIPDFGGFTVKADSEGQVGPSKYGGTPADAANMLARALKPHGGVVLYRSFVYNNHLDWHDLKADRARAAYDIFTPLDGKFDPNVIIQIKEGPIDFQAIEPVSPLFAGLRHTPEAIETQTTQEYTGQQRQMVWLPSMWKWVLDTDMRVDGRYSPVKQILSGKIFHQPTGGYVSVVNVGLDPNWLHHPMAMANLWGFGQLAWNPNQPLPSIIDTWTRLTWGNNPKVDSTIDAMQLASWQNYVHYTGPNGMGTLTGVVEYHYGPWIESAEHNGWGQWFRAEKDGIGMNRTVATGTGFIGQYPPQLAAKYEPLATCPDDLLLFFHHVPYNYKLHSGKTLVQNIYDTHYAAALAVAKYVPQWESLKGLVDDQRYEKTLALFTYQAGDALVWRDAINNWFQRTSGIKDDKGRVGHDPYRIEAEDMKAVGYVPVDVHPEETASGGKAVICHGPAPCALTTTIHKPAGKYDIAVQYFDIWDGVSKYDLLINGKSVATWAADNTLPPVMPDPNLNGPDSTRFTAHGVSLKPGDTLVLSGTPDIRPELAPGPPAPPPPGTPRRFMRRRPDLREFAPVDYIEIGPNGPITPQ